MMAQQRAPALGSDRFLLGIVVGAVLLIVVSIGAVVVVRQSPPPAPPDPNSPVGVVHAYIDAIRAGDYSQARGYLTAEQRAALLARDWPTYAPPGNDTVRIVVEPVREDATTAEVHITISRFSAGPGPFSAGTSHRDYTIHLVREDGAWRMTSALEPYAFS
jgi:hypothetical protein